MRLNGTVGASAPIAFMLMLLATASAIAAPRPGAVLAPPIDTVEPPHSPLAAPQGPAPQNVHMLPGGPIVHTLVWDRLPGVTGYNIYFNSAKTKGTWILANAAPLLAETFADTSFPLAGTMYRVTALYADGRQGSTVFVYANPPQMQVPTGFTAQQIGPGQVRLAWQPVSLAKGYRVFGAGQPQDGTVVTATELVLSQIPDGTYSWQLTADYGGAYQGAGMPVASITLATAPSGNYLVTVTGLRAVQASADNTLSFDGKGDEVYVRAFVRDYDRRNGGVVMFTNRGTMTYGDVNGRGTSRMQAGTGSQTGGIQDGDPIPPNTDPTDRTGNPSDTALPLRLWQGPLTSGVDALVISPTVWEEDAANQAALLWNQQMTDITGVLFQRQEIQNQIMAAAFAPILFGTSAMQGWSDVASAALGSATLGLSLTYQAAQKLFTGDSDRPIGLIPSGVADVSMVLPNETVVLTREIIEAALAPLPRGTPPIGPPAWPRMPKPGVMMIPFRDGPHGSLLGAERPAYYEMYLKVERIP